MFIQNKEGEVVNVDQVLAVKVYDDAKPYQINVFTEKTETVFEFESEDDVKEAFERIYHHLFRSSLRWIHCSGWHFRADKVLSINDEPCRNLTVSMVGKVFHVYLNAKSDDDLFLAKQEIEESLAEDFFNTGKIYIERIG